MKIENYDQELLIDWRKLQDRVAAIKSEWESYIYTGKVKSENIIPAEVLSSWARCRNRGLDPYNVPNIILSEAELNIRLEKNKRMLDVVSPFLQAMVDSIRGTGFRVDYYDADLYLLRHFGDEQVLESFKQIPSGPGVSRSEVNNGTNAMNLAALLEKPIQLVGPEHYNTELHTLTCTSVPIMGEDGTVQAVINTAGFYWLMHRHTLGMMIALGKSIEYSLYQRRIRKDMEITNRSNEAIIESISDAIVVVDPSGKVTVANQRAQKQFSTRGQNIIGYPIESLWGGSNPFAEVIVTAEPIIDREISLLVDGKKIRMMGTIRPITSGEMGMQGVVGTFKGMNTARGMIKNFAGWKAHYSFENLIGDSMEFRQAVRLARETANLQSNILIQGESGTGKELFAQSIHNASFNRESPFVVVNCAAIPNGLLESELFGYEGGAFTGAKKEGHPGKFELADGGTIFLDEINSLPLDMQAKLLRTLQNKTVIRVGGNEEIPVNLRVIAASNSDLWQMVKRGEFREDLFYRINVITISIPPLRDRGDDIELLINDIGRRLTRKLGIQIEMDQKTLELLRKYHWPGNVRELENVIERSNVMAKTRGSNLVTIDDIMSYPGFREMPQNRNAGNDRQFIDDKDDICVLKDIEKEALQKALAANNGNITKAAQMLGVARNTLYRKMKHYGIK